MTSYHFERLFPVEIEDRLRVMPVLVLSFALWNGTAAILPLGLDGGVGPLSRLGSDC